MGNFTFYAPTRVYFGRKEEERIGSILKQEGCHRVLVHYGGQSAVKSGLLDRVLASLKKAGISAVTLGGVVPNPQLSKVREGIALGCARESLLLKRNRWTSFWQLGAAV